MPPRGIAGPVPFSRGRRAAHSFLAQLRPPLHISHRGGAALAPENTMVAFRQAVDLYRTDMIELDVHVTRDGELVVAHDATLDRCTDAEGPIADWSLGELARLDAGYRFTPDAGRSFPFRGAQIRIPTLREVLNAFPSLALNIELKPRTPGIEDLLARVVRRAQATGRVCIGSEDDEVAARAVAALPEACAFYPASAAARAVLALRQGNAPPDDVPYLVLDLPLYFEQTRVVDRALLEAARVHGRWVNVWTVDAPDEMRLLLCEGIDGIMTDRPDLLRAVLDTHSHQLI